MVNINALSQDHPGVLNEQCALSNGGLHQGDVFHPDFQHGRPAYFDISICSTILSPFSASYAGVAAAAGEVAKHEKHFASVEKVGSDFIPLVLKCFGVWTPFALNTLCTIADCTTPHSGNLARKNLLQQLSVALWIQNDFEIWGIDIDKNLVYNTVCRLST